MAMAGEPGSVSELMAAASLVSQSPPGNVLRETWERVSGVDYVWLKS